MNGKHGMIEKIFDFKLERMGWRYLKKTSTLVSYVTVHAVKNETVQVQLQEMAGNGNSCVMVLCLCFIQTAHTVSFYSFRLLVFYLYRCCADSAENSCTHLQQNTMRLFSYSKLSVFFFGL